jgi:hypothetical protein
MATPELTAALPATTSTRIPVPRPRYIALTYLTLFAATAAAAVIAPLDPSLFTSSAPHPTLFHSLGAAASIFATNLRVAVVPFILIALRFQAGRASRLIADVLLAGVLGGNAVLVGLALGRWQDRLVPYLPHLPIEYLAIAAAAGAWLDARRHPDRPAAPRAIAGYAALAVVLLMIAAAVEVLATPHRR